MAQPPAEANVTPEGEAPTSETVTGMWVDVVSMIGTVIETETETASGTGGAVGARDEIATEVEIAVHRGEIAPLRATVTGDGPRSVIVGVTAGTVNDPATGIVTVIAHVTDADEKRAVSWVVGVRSDHCPSLPGGREEDVFAEACAIGV